MKRENIKMEKNTNIRAFEYQENILARMLEFGGKIFLKCDRLPSWVSELEGKYIELKDHVVDSDNYFFRLTDEGYKFARRINSLK